MENPIVVAYHLMWTLYGWWLPNEPRGSTSRALRNDLIAELGELHLGRKQIQPASQDLRDFYAQAAETLQHPLLAFLPGQFAVVAVIFGEVIREYGYTCYGFAVMPDHVHILIRKHRDRGEEMVEKIQTLSRKRLEESGLREPGHPTWTRGGWKVFLDHPDDVWRTIRYIEDNPVKFGLPVQEWDWVKPYDNWPLHNGHSQNSPYAKGLRAAGRLPR
jgi:REP element-mobilizing transposase RayT